MTTNETPTPKADKKAKTRSKKRKWSWGRLFGLLGALTLVGAVFAGIALLMVLNHFGRGLPDYRQLADYEPPIITRIHAGDGSLMREFATQPRLFVPIDVVPEKLISAFLSAEDRDFYKHGGLDYFGMLRANIRNVMHLIRGRSLEGGSTITQQVARNFLLTLDQRIDRKIKEMILTMRIERAFTKDQILELYLNEINFGNRSYGVAAAALNYFNKSLNELTTAQMAFLAALPKAPHNYHPRRHKDRALGRRNWILGRMLHLDYIGEDEYNQAIAEDLLMVDRPHQDRFQADYFAEEVRRQLARKYGTKTLYGGGLSVHTTLEPRMQEEAEKALRNGLVTYDRRHGWRGALARLSGETPWQESLLEINKPLGIDTWTIATVLELQEDGVVVGLKDGSYGFIPLKEMSWARPWREGEKLGPKVKDVSDVLSIKDVVVVEKLKTRKFDKALDTFFTDDGAPIGTVAAFGLRQIPQIEGALVAMDPHTGRVLAMVGGFNYEKSQFNRATQAERQPGSSFKPFVYAAALDNGFTPASLVLDAPFVMDQGEGQGKWKPSNSTNRFYGPSTLRLGMERSRNLMTVRLAQYIGMDKVQDYAQRFGIGKHVDPTLSMSLGAGETSLMNLTAAYAMLVNGGRKITPSLVDRIQDRRGSTIYKHDERMCMGCDDVWEAAGGLSEPEVVSDNEQVIDERTAYQVVSLLEGVVQRGTGRKIRAVRVPLAGKTGTTNDWIDGWFVGFSPDLAVGVFVGFDRPRSMGRNEEGSAVSAPIFRDFMKATIGREPAVPFRVPSGIRLVRINAQTGLPAEVGTKNVIYEAFLPGTEPFGERLVLDGAKGFVRGSKIRKGTGGLY